MNNFSKVSQQIKELKREETFEFSFTYDTYRPSVAAKAKGGIAWGLLFALLYTFSIILYVITRGKVNFKSSF
ncbi:MAG: hypothetical protein R2799_16565 [Crocinitomicaceae bacterium]